ncbi:MAG: epoxyqueuosine reductase QueH [Sulfurimonas sp.]|jgi:predicted adenine nucleotide alpha hydrolase (AANH) superfamily ATPase|nr:epoxyqueuosine reductase QueH [Sulfurimonadaceae bacterium]
MLVHICCSVDSHFFLQKLQKDFPQERLVGFFYDPNIHPYSEYQLRLLDVKRSCKKLNIELLEGDYDFEDWLEVVRGLENEPEKGARCAKCFDKRLYESFKKAKSIGEKKVTTTLLVSPLKSQEQLISSAKNYTNEFDIEFIYIDYRADGGTQKQSEVSKDEQLYRQDYCGCIYGLSMQREHQQKLMDEMFSHISKQVLPASIEQRLELYAKRNELEDELVEYKIIKEKFLNYRQFSLKTFIKKELVPSYGLFYSTLPRKKAEGRIEFIDKEIGYFNREEIRFITLSYLNKNLQKNYRDVFELIFEPLSVDEELALRQKIALNPYSLSPIIVLDELSKEKITIELDAIVYEDTKEKLIII